MPSRPGSSTSCSPTRPTARAGRPTWSAWAARATCSDPRFVIQHAGDPEYSLITRSSDGQLMFLVNKLTKMKHDTPPRQPHRRGAQRLVALHRRRRPGREQHPPLDHRERLAGGHHRPAAEHVLQHRHRHLHLGADQPQARAPPGQGAAHRRHRLVRAAAQEPRQEELRAVRGAHPSASATLFLAFEETEQSKIFPNAAFGYWKVTVERPLRLARRPERRRAWTGFATTCAEAKEEPLAKLVRPRGRDARPRPAPGLQRRHGRLRDATPTGMASS